MFSCNSAGAIKPIGHATENPKAVLEAIIDKHEISKYFYKTALDPHLDTYVENAFPRVDIRHNPRKSGWSRSEQVKGVKNSRRFNAITLHSRL